MTHKNIVNAEKNKYEFIGKKFNNKIISNVRVIGNSANVMYILLDENNKEISGLPYRYKEIKQMLKNENINNKQGFEKGKIMQKQIEKYILGLPTKELTDKELLSKILSTKYNLSLEITNENIYSLWLILDSYREKGSTWYEIKEKWK